MAKKEEIGKDVKELKAKIQDNKVVIGNEKVLKGLRDRSLSKIFLASNCPSKMKEEINYYAKLAEITVTELGLDNEELGLFCKKNFFVSAIGTIGE